MQEFVSIDFETANGKRGSACSVGLVRFDARGEPAQTLSTLLRPHPDYAEFTPFTTAVHGLTADSVCDAPTWADVAPEVYALIGDLPLVAHNMPFDGSVLRSLAELYGLDAPANPRLCTLHLARMLLTGQLPRMRLPDVYGYYFPGEGINHHEAAADAMACGRIFARMQRDLPFAEMPATTGFSSARRPGPNAGIKAHQAAAGALLTQFGGREGALAGERVCVTGTLRHAARAAVQELIVALGGEVHKNVTTKTTLLVVGAGAHPGSASRKITRAEELAAQGQAIRVLNEEEFFRLLAG